jgi:hypothetical protein
MVWSCIGKNDKSLLIFIDGNLIAQQYITLLSQNKVFEFAKSQLNNQ